MRLLSQQEDARLLCYKDSCRCIGAVAVPIPLPVRIFAMWLHDAVCCQLLLASVRHLLAFQEMRCAVGAIDSAVFHQRLAAIKQASLMVDGRVHCTHFMLQNLKKVGAVQGLHTSSPASISDHVAWHGMAWHVRCILSCLADCL